MSTPNMGLTLPVVSTTIGPTWASLLNTALTTVDTHDHTAGNGVQVPSAGLNINADVSMGSFNLTTIRSLRLDNQVATLSLASDLRILYSKNGELAYRDSAGNEVILTASGSVAGATGTISGLVAPASASFNAITGIYSFLKDTAKPGKFVTSDILVYEYDNATANPITVKSPASLASAYSLTLPPAVPTQSAILSMGTTGILTTGLANGTAGAPSLAFASALSTGLFISSGSIAVSIAGSTSMLFGASAILNSDGSAAHAAYSFASDDDTGVYRIGANNLGLAVAGTKVFDIEATQATITGVPLRAYTGSVSAPGYSFAGDTNTGMYTLTGDQLGFATGGVLQLEVTSSATTSSNQYTGPAAVASTPTYGFFDQNGVGMYRSASATIGFAGGSVYTGGISELGLEVGTSGNGFWKAKVFGGQLTTLATVDLTTGGNIVGACGYFKAVAGSTWNAISDGQASTSTTVRIDNGHTDYVRLYNETGVTCDYRMIVFYQV